jgi:aspartokinase/homoserine dehydrogenase 1
MTADPRIVADATPLTHLSYDEALELATFGASVLHPRTILPLLETGILLRIRNTLDPDSAGTRVDAAGGNDETRATSVTSLEAQALIDVQLQTLDAGPRIAERVHRAVQETTETVWLATHSAHGQAMSIVVPEVVAQAVKAAIETALALEIDRGELKPISVHGPVSLLTLVGEAMGRTPNVAGQLFSALGRVGINVRTIGQSASARSISCVVDSAVLPLAVRTVHTAFHLTHRRASILLLGKGIVGGALLGQIAEQVQMLREQHDVEPVVVGLADRTRALFDPHGITAGTETERLASMPQAAGAWGPVTEAMLDELATLPVPILVDCTASDTLAPLYKAAWQRGIHVVAANKKPLTLSLADVADLRATARRSHSDWRYETTVGAALPVIDTLQHLVRTGDSVTRIQGSLSGTLGYLCDELSAGVPLGDAVRTAKRLGFTEPRPQEDLAGTDAARKALILARELGLQLEMSDVVIEPLVPAELLDIDDVDTFLAALDTHTALAEQVAANRRDGKVLRYIATVDPNATPKLHVGPVAVTEGHPAYSLRGPASMVAFSSRRYPDEPLVVQGAGAGGEVTAAGVLADILRLAMTNDTNPVNID